MVGRSVCGDVSVVLVQAVGVDAVGDWLLPSSRQLSYSSPHLWRPPTR